MPFLVVRNSKLPSGIALTSAWNLSRLAARSSQDNGRQPFRPFSCWFLPLGRGLQICPLSCCGARYHTLRHQRGKVILCGGNRRCHCCLHFHGWDLLLGGAGPFILRRIHSHPPLLLMELAFILGCLGSRWQLCAEAKFFSLVNVSE